MYKKIEKNTVQVRPGQWKKDHRAKKSLGQNFLKSVLALNNIIKAGEIEKNDIILEIGPGKGALTSKLLESAGTVIAVEKDRDLTLFLKDKFKKEIEEEKLILVEKDILDFSLTDIHCPGPTWTVENSTKNVRSKGKSKTLPTVQVGPGQWDLGCLNYKVIANIPYNITGAILKKFLTEENQPKMLILMVQNEVAKRIIGKKTGKKQANIKESILSISVKAYGEPKIVMKVAKRYFSPSPKVDSAIISIKNISRNVFIQNKIKEEKFWKLVHAGFAHKRKILISNLKSYDKKVDWNSIFKKLDIKEKVRAEELPLYAWISLTKEIS